MTMKIHYILLMLGLLFSSPAQAAKGKELSLDAFAMLPVFQQVTLSPNGKKLAMIRAVNKGGHYILEIYDTDHLNKKPVRLGAAERLEFNNVTWLNDKRLLVRFRQNLKTENTNFLVSKTSIINANGKGKWMELPSDRAFLLSTLPNDPRNILISYDVDAHGTKTSVAQDVFERYPDVVKFDVFSGRSRAIYKGNSKISGGYGFDHDGELRTGISFDIATNKQQFYARLKDSKDWKLVWEVHAADRESFRFNGFDDSNPNLLYVILNNGDDKTGIYQYDLTTGTLSDRIFGAKSVDVGGAFFSRKPSNFGALNGFRYSTKRTKYYWINSAEQKLFESAQALFPGKEVFLVSRTENDDRIIIYTENSKDAGSYYLLKDKSKLEYLGSNMPLLTEEHLSTTKYIKYTARDGLPVYAYVTIPKGKGPFPSIVMPHGGPWVRDSTSYDEWSQLLAHHGYAVIRPNYRGSTGYGLTHWKAGDGKWGHEMQDDLDDAMAYLVSKGIADKDKLAIFGWSYGGYAAFAAATRGGKTPYKCSIAGAGVADLDVMRASTDRNRFLRIFQRPTLNGHNPIDNVEKVQIPMLIIHGDEDERVNISHSNAFVRKLKSAGKEYKYVVLKGANHFSITLTYEHKTQFYSELLNYLENRCFK